MSADGVPPWARPVMEALQLAHSLRTSDAVNGRCATSGEIEMADAHVRDACAAALASDAGMPEGERVEGWTGKPGPCPNCGAIRNERDAHFCSSTRSASAPLAESGAAAPDAPRGNEGRHSRPRRAGEAGGARGRLRDMDVPTRHRVPERATDATPGATWSHVREMHADALAALRSVGPPNCDQPDAGGGLYYPLLFLLAAVEAHERAIMIGLMAIVEESVPAPAPAPGDASEAAFRDALHLPETSPVDLVRRREEEEA